MIISLLLGPGGDGEKRLDSCSRRVNRGTIHELINVKSKLRITHFVYLNVKILMRVLHRRIFYPNKNKQRMLLKQLGENAVQRV